MGKRDPDLDDTAGKSPADDHPGLTGEPANPSDHADPRVAQPGDDPPDEDALGSRPSQPSAPSDP